VRVGLIRGAKQSPRVVRVYHHEPAYMSIWWPVLSALRQELRTAPDVHLAALFGRPAVALDPCGDEPLMVYLELPADRYLRSKEVGERLERAAARPVTFVHARLRHMSPNDIPPPWLLDLVRHGRPIVNRSRHWASLRNQRRCLSLERNLIATAAAPPA
jgi:hypothetical protein